MMNVLIVDDEKEIVEHLAEFLSDELQCEVVKCYDGKEAFEACQKLQFDLICTDHKMKEMNGSEFIVALRNSVGHNAQVPVILISAFIPDVPSRIHEIEKVFFVEKPVAYDRLLRYAKMSMIK